MSTSFSDNIVKKSDFNKTHTKPKTTSPTALPGKSNTILCNKIISHKQSKPKSIKDMFNFHAIKTNPVISDSNKSPRGHLSDNNLRYKRSHDDSYSISNQKPTKYSPEEEIRNQTTDTDLDKL